ncbi:MAG: LysR family transcriptional regulator [Micropruina glycogenica]
MSQQIKRLERGTGVTLLERAGRAWCSPTPDGSWSPPRRRCWPT